MAAILRVKDENGNVIDIPTIKGKDGKNGVDGKDGKDYVLTDEDKQEIADIIKGSEDERLTETVTLDAYNTSSLIITDIANGSIMISAVESAGIPAGVEIANVEFLYNSNYISIKDLYTVEGYPYYYSMNETFVDNNSNIFILSIGYGGSQKGLVIDALYNYEPIDVKVTFYVN